MLLSIGKFVVLLGLLYMFICSLDILSSAFQLVGGKPSRARLHNDVKSFLRSRAVSTLLQIQLVVISPVRTGRAQSDPPFFSFPLVCVSHKGFMLCDLCRNTTIDRKAFSYYSLYIYTHTYTHTTKSDFCT